MKKIVSSFIGMSFALIPFSLCVAQVSVVESTSVQQQQAVQAKSNANAELFSQLQLLQDEVLRMQGLLEEQQHEIGKLKQQRLDDYVNLDKRISELSVQPKPTVPASTMPIAATSTSAIATVNSSNDKAEYKAAYALVKQRKFDEAKTAFQSFLQNNPQSNYVPNVHYWLGELYILDSNFSRAATEFSYILDNYPGTRKYPEALYKLAKVNYELGKRDIAKKQLDDLIESYSETSVSTVRMAREFIQKHYP